METSDHELLRLFVKNRSEDAFRQMVDRHLNLVFATARRIVGDPQLAEEIAQGVFVLLARKAAEIKSNQPLAGWLYHTTRHQALNASRAEGRRRQREHTAAAMQPNETEPAPELIAAELEQVMDELSVDDRDALVLRFLDNRRLHEVGTELGISEEAARKRVNRALEKLRGIFGKRGIALSTGLLATALAGEAVTAAPVALGSAITATALSQLAGATAVTTTITATQGAMNTMNLLNLKTVAAILGVAAVTGTSTYLVKEREADKLRADYRSLMGAQAELVKDRQDAAAAVQLRDEEIEELKKNVEDMPRLRGEIDRLNREKGDLKQLALESDQLRSELARLRGQKESDQDSLLRLEMATNGPRRALPEEVSDIIKVDPDTESGLGPPPKMETRSYRVDSEKLISTFGQLGAGGDRQDNNGRFRLYLEHSGVRLPPGSRVAIDELRNTLVVLADTNSLVQFARSMEPFSQ
ncbi:sigma-70 family RNA polymerase sigma factor [bacterium]|nr:sigma-70 family RNA polymerase sigma factor [bacterium]